MAKSILSRWLFLLFVFGIIFLSFSPSFVSADEDEGVEVEDEEEVDSTKAEKEDEDEFEEDDGIIRAHPNVRTVALFPDFPDKRFHVLTKIVALVGIHNKADVPLNLTAIGAHFQSPYDLSYYIQNFTIRELSQVGGQVIEPHSQATLEYAFYPDKSLEPIEYWISGWVEYNSSEGVEYRNTWVNGSVHLIEKDTEFDIRKLFSYFLVLSGIGLVVYILLNYAQTTKKVKKSAETGTQRRETTDDDWGTAWVPEAVSRRAGSSRRKKPISSKKKTNVKSPSNKASAVSSE